MKTAIVIRFWINIIHVLCCFEHKYHGYTCIILCYRYHILHTLCLFCYMHRMSYILCCCCRGRCPTISLVQCTVGWGQVVGTMYPNLASTLPSPPHNYCWVCVPTTIFIKLNHRHHHHHQGTVSLYFYLVLNTRGLYNFIEMWVL